MPTKNARTFRLSSLTERQLDALAAQWGTSLTETLTLIIDRAWRVESFAGEHSAADMADIDDAEEDSRVAP